MNRGRGTSGGLELSAICGKRVFQTGQRAAHLYRGTFYLYNIYIYIKETFPRVTSANELIASRGPVIRTHRAICQRLVCPCIRAAFGRSASMPPPPPPPYFNSQSTK